MLAILEPSALCQAFYNLATSPYTGAMGPGFLLVHDIVWLHVVWNGMETGLITVGSQCSWFIRGDPNSESVE